MKINKEVLKNWLRALRSGKYQQTTGRLHEGQGFCCLGVLCDLCPEGEWGEPGSITGTPCKDYCGSVNDLPAEVLKWAGLDENTYDVPVPIRHLPKTMQNEVLREGLGTADEKRTEPFVWVSVLNDQEYSFNDVANILEKAFGEEPCPT
jgi:hypothetical protein